jgi:hypothetical protein
MIIIIPGELVDLNTYIDAERTNRYSAAKIKKDMTKICELLGCRAKQFDGDRAKVIITWYCKNRMKDPDNIAFAKKFILDGLVTSGVLEGDGWRQIQGFEDRFEIDKDKPRIEIELQEVG